MEGLAFFLAGLPLVVVLNHLVIDLTTFDEELVDDETGRVLPWQVGPWPDRVRWAVLLLLPAMMAVAGLRFDLLQAIAVSLLVAALLTCTATDLLRFRVPNVVTYPGIILALAAAVLLPDGDVADALLAAAVGGGFFFVLAFITAGGIGLGDVKLAMLIGAGLGLQIGLQALFWGILAAAVVMGALLVIGVVSRRQAIPYAPFLSLAAIVVLLMQGTAFAPL
jgi:prepilin signal peptidase PulO-like enzyme (type II secretory pathway)